MSSYGFVHLPSLLTFIRPQPAIAWKTARDAVDAFAASASHDKVDASWDTMAARVASMANDERQETVLRLTALAHETRHFHDFLLTPYGNRLVRDAFWYSLLTFGALTELAQGAEDGQRIKVALPVDPSLLPTYGKRLLTMRSAFHERAQQGLSLMEANAMHVQIQQAEIDLGHPAAEALSGALRRMPTRYSEVLRVLWQLQDDLGIVNADFAAVALVLTLIPMLDEMPGQIENLATPVAERARGLSGRSAAQRILAAILPTIERVISRAMTAAQQENEKFLDTLDKAAPEPLRELVKDAFADFAGAAADLQQIFLHDPMLLLDPGRYLREGLAELVMPFVYLLPDGLTTMQVKDRSWEAKLSDPLTYVREYEVEGRRVFQLACVPAPVPKHALDESAWKNFADAIAGSLVIAEGADREHPVEGMWIRKMEDRWPITFTSFGARAAWQVAPVGEVV